MACLLDTNIVSELQKGDRCRPKVREWYNGCVESDLFLSIMVLGELRRGIELRRARDSVEAHSLELWIRGLESTFGNRILPISLEIAHIWGRLCLRQQLPVVDGLLAATALHHNLTLVTRNIQDVARSGADCFNPFGD